MNDKKTDWIFFLLFIVISLFAAFLGKIVVTYLGFKSIYGILIGFFIPAGIIEISPISISKIKGLLGTIVLTCVLLIVPTIGLSIIFLPFIIIIICIIVVSIKGLKAMPIFLFNFFSAQFKRNLKISTKNENKDKKIVKRFENGDKDMKIVKSFKNCDNNEQLLDRLDKLRENISKYSNGELIKAIGSAINTNWNWINYFEIRLDNDKNGNIRIEMWVADVKHQWNDLAKVSSMDFVSKQEPIYLIKGLDINAEHYIGAYIKLGDTYGKTLAVTDYELDYVKSNFNKQYYKDFYQTIGGQWKKDLNKEDFIKNDKLLTEEIQKLPLVNKNKIINYIKNETRNVINLSLGTTVNLSIPINDLAKKDMNFNYENNIDELAQPLYHLLMEYKNKIES